MPALGCGPGIRGSHEIRSLLVLVRGWRVACDFGLPNFLGLFCTAMAFFAAEFWASFVLDNTNPKLLRDGLTVDILGCGLRPVGYIHIPVSTWVRLVPPSFLSTPRETFSRLRPASDEGNIMARALIGQGVLILVRDPDLGPNGSFFPVPKNWGKASFSKFGTLLLVHAFSAPAFANTLCCTSGTFTIGTRPGTYALHASEGEGRLRPAYHCIVGASLSAYFGRRGNHCSLVISILVIVFGA